MEIEMNIRSNPVGSVHMSKDSWHAVNDTRSLVRITFGRYVESCTNTVSKSLEGSLLYIFIRRMLK